MRLSIATPSGSSQQSLAHLSLGHPSRGLAATALHWCANHARPTWRESYPNFTPTPAKFFTRHTQAGLETCWGRGSPRCGPLVSITQKLRSQPQPRRQLSVLWRPRWALRAWRPEPGEPVQPLNKTPQQLGEGKGKCPVSSESYQGPRKGALW